jgi:GGDEF domain-containing protein
MSNDYRTAPVAPAIMVNELAQQHDHSAPRRHQPHPHAYPHHEAPPPNAEDVASLLGLPAEQVTADLLARLGPVLAERDELRQRLHHGSRRLELLGHQAERDCVVPAMNRRAFIREVEAFAAQPGARGVVVVLHVGGVEALRLVHGLAAGEGVLRHVCAAALSHLRSTDHIALLGGSDFGLLMPDCSEPDARQRLGEMCRAVNDPRFGWMGQPQLLVTLYGIHALAPGDSGEHAVAAADARRRGVEV